MWSKVELFKFFREIHVSPAILWWYFYFSWDSLTYQFFLQSFDGVPPPLFFHDHLSNFCFFSWTFVKFVFIYFQIFDKINILPAIIPSSMPAIAMLFIQYRLLIFSILMICKSSIYKKGLKLSIKHFWVVMQVLQINILSDIIF